jgi:uncharacterized membrane protein YbhN (UPF0104 family)
MGNRSPSGPGEQPLDLGPSGPLDGAWLGALDHPRREDPTPDGNGLALAPAVCRPRARLFLCRTGGDGADMGAAGPVKISGDSLDGTGLASRKAGRWAQARRWIIGFGVAGLYCWLLVRGLDWQGLAAALGSANYRWAALGALAIVSTFFTRTWRWQALLWQSKVRLQAAMTALLVGQVVNQTLPMRSGDVMRAVWISPERGTGATEALGSIALEKVWDLLALLVCGLILLAWMPLPGWFSRSTWGTALTLALVGGLLWAGLHWQAPLFRWAGRVMAYLPVGWDQALLPRLRRLTNGLEAIRRPDVSAQAFFWTGMTWGLGALANLAVLAAFGIPSTVAALFLLAALMVGGTVPTPGRLGIYEGVCVVSLALFGIPRDQALAVGLVLHLIVMGPPLIVAAALTLWPDRRSGRVDGPA